jgi:Beta protein
MTFGPDHYVPVLKVKRGEKKALQSISPEHQVRITPLLEIVGRKPERAVDQHLNTSFDHLTESVRSYARCFLDAREMAPDGPAAASEVFRRAANEGIMFTPVTGVSRTSDVAAALECRTRGVALRLTRDEFEAGGLATKIGAFLAQHGLEPEEVDLIIDMGAVEDLIAQGIAMLTRGFIAEVPHHERWRTFTISACAFPKSMGGIERNSHELVPREEWIAWRDHLFVRRDSLPRLPTFSDCAIQHPSGVEGFDPRTMQVSASIRYTRPQDWLLIKGESTRFTRPGVQFPELATRLVYGHLRGNFAGASHCEGCASMKAAADGAPRFGAAEAWSRLGTIHHISTVIQGLDSLPSP